jgi:endonuclease/exonuclease/phosphatase family metal-dependent hydrolase
VFTVATWNLENLFRPGGEAGPATDEAYDAKLSALQAVIDRLAPDVVAVQEVGEPAALEDLRGRLGAGWQSALSTLADRRGIRVGFLSRLPLREIEHINAFPPQLAAVQQDDRHVIAQTTGRGVLRVRVGVDGLPVDLVTCH